MASKPIPEVQAFTLGQPVILDTRDLSGYRRYSDKFTGHTPVSEQNMSQAYKLQLRDGWNIHNVVHGMVLSPYTNYKGKVRAAH